jgi:death-on-curing protein
VRYLSLEEVLELHRMILRQSGGMSGLRESDALESALAQPHMTFGGEDLYPSLAEKAASLGFSLIKNHPFLDGNKRIGHAVMETFLVLNGYEIQATTDEQEEIILRLAAGELDRATFTNWLRSHISPHAQSSREPAGGRRALF